MDLRIRNAETRLVYDYHVLGNRQTIGILPSETFGIEIKNGTRAGNLARVMHGDIDILTGAPELDPTRFEGPLWFIPSGQVLSISTELQLPGDVVFDNRFAMTGGTVSVYTFGSSGRDALVPYDRPHNMAVSALANGLVTVYQKDGKVTRNLSEVDGRGLINPQPISKYVLHYVMWDALVEQMRQSEQFTGDADALERFVSSTTG